jgi:hypothetical protein
LAEPEETVDWLVEGRITAGSIAIMAAKPKVGKSTAARALALAVARGGAWLGFRCAAGMAWYQALEGRRRDIRAHFRQMGAREDDALRVFVGQAPREVIQDVRRLADQERPALIVVDTMQRFLKAQSTDDYAEMTTLLDAVIGIAQQSVCSRWELEEHHQRLLTLAGEAWDRGQQAREAVLRDGLTTTKDGGLRAHPALRVETDCRLTFARLIRELDLDLDAPPAATRPAPLRSLR